MRVLKPDVSKYRKKKILQTAVSHYIRTNKPVSSRVISGNYGVNLSPATVRNLITSLEKEGFLKHIHTSSGCVPTDKGYRYFVDSLIELQGLAIDERKRIIEEFKIRMRELDELFVHTSHLLSVVSNYVGFVLEPKLEKSRFRSLQLLKISEYELLVLIITKSGLVKHQILNVGSPIDDGLVGDITRLLNEKFKEIPLSELAGRLPDIIDEIKQHREVSERIINALSQRLLKESEENIYLEGTGNIVSMLNLANHDRVCSLMQLIEQKRYLAQLLKEDLDSFKDTKVTIGKEHLCPGFEDVSLIKTTYKFDENPIGILGIIGPKRMEYSKMISLVNFVAGAVNKVINKLAGTK